MTWINSDDNSIYDSMTQGVIIPGNPSLSRMIEKNMRVILVAENFNVGAGPVPQGIRYECMHLCLMFLYVRMYVLLCMLVCKTRCMHVFWIVGWTHSCMPKRLCVRESYEWNDSISCKQQSLFWRDCSVSPQTMFI